MQIGKFTLVNDEKVNRAMFGTLAREGKLSGGVGEHDENAILAEYDRLGGLVQIGTTKVKIGSFYDFEKRAPRKTPDVVLQFRDIAGNLVELKDGEALPLEVQAAELSKKTKKVSKKKVTDD